MKQLKRDGTLGSYRTFEHVSYQTVVDRLRLDGSEVEIETRIGFHNPRPSKIRLSNEDAIAWLLDKRGTYCYDAVYYDGDKTMRVAAMYYNGLL